MDRKFTRRRFIRGTLAVCLGMAGCGGSPSGTVPRKSAFTIKKDGEKVTVTTKFPVPKKKGAARKH